MLVINCKNYAEVATPDRITRLVKTADIVAANHGIAVGVAPPQHLLGVAAGVSTASKKLVILAQHTDMQYPGSTTGYVIPEMLKMVGITGSIINHSEHRISARVVEDTIRRLRESSMISILCVRNIAEVKKYAIMRPDYIAIEPPELIGSGRAVSNERPTLISKAADAIVAASLPSDGATAAGMPRLLCGAGIVTGADVAKAVELGSAGVLVASGVIKKVDKWKNVISELAAPLASTV